MCECVWVPTPLHYCIHTQPVTPLSPQTRAVISVNPDCLCALQTGHACANCRRLDQRQACTQTHSLTHRHQHRHCHCHLGCLQPHHIVHAAPVDTRRHTTISLTASPVCHFINNVTLSFHLIVLQPLPVGRYLPRRSYVTLYSPIVWRNLTLDSITDLHKVSVSITNYLHKQQLLNYWGDRERENEWGGGRCAVTVVVRVGGLSSERQ